MTCSGGLVIKPGNLVEPRLALADLQQLVEHEAALLYEQRFEEWLGPFADDSAYWVPAKPRQQRPLNHISLFYVDKHTLGIRSSACVIRRFTARFRVRRLSGGRELQAGVRIGKL